nr:unnamed protein product [Callosobruchus analis]
MDENLLLAAIGDDGELNSNIAQAVVLLQESQSITADALNTANLLNIDRNQRTTVDNFYEDIDNFSSEIFQSHFRMERRTMDALTEYIATKVQTDASIIPLKNKVLLMVWLLANKSTYREAANLFGLEKSSVSYVFHEICKLIAGLRYEFIKWPTRDEYLETAARIKSRYHVPNCVGFIDGCHTEIKAPANNPTDFYDRKETHSIILQAIVFGRNLDASSSQQAPENVETVPVQDDTSVLRENIEGLSEESSSTSSEIVLPAMIRSYPKAPPRKMFRRCRQPGKTKILTITPEKENIHIGCPTEIPTTSTSCEVMEHTQVIGSTKMQKVDHVKRTVFKQSDNEQVIKNNQKEKENLEAREKKIRKKKVVKVVHKKARRRKKVLNDDSSETECEDENISYADSSSDEDFEKILRWTVVGIVLFTNRKKLWICVCVAHAVGMYMRYV